MVWYEVTKTTEAVLLAVPFTIIAVLGALEIKRGAQNYDNFEEWAEKNPVKAITWLIIVALLLLIGLYPYSYSAYQAIYNYTPPQNAAVLRGFKL